MGRNLIYKLVGAFIILLAAVFWLLSILIPDVFGAFSLAWAGVLICGGLGIVLLAQGVVQKNVSTIKKLKIWFSVVLFICAVLCLVSALVIPYNLVLPIISIIVAFGLIITILATGGVKWDEGDNHKKGYKNYFERKEEENKISEKENVEIKKNDLSEK